MRALPWTVILLAAGVAGRRSRPRLPPAGRSGAGPAATSRSRPAASPRRGRPRVRARCGAGRWATATPPSSSPAGRSSRCTARPRASSGPWRTRSGPRAPRPRSWWPWTRPRDGRSGSTPTTPPMSRAWTWSTAPARTPRRSWRTGSSMPWATTASCTPSTRDRPRGVVARPPRSSAAQKQGRGYSCSPIAYGDTSS